MDGTLVELHAAVHRLFVEAFDVSFGLDATSSDWADYESGSDAAVAAEILRAHLGRPPESRELDRVLGTYADLLERALAADRVPHPPVPGAAELVRTLEERDDVGLALATGNLRATARLRLAPLELWSPFTCGGFAEDGPDKTAILGAALAAGRRTWGSAWRTNGVLYIGDQPVDAVAARTHGIDFVGVAHRPGRREALHEAGAERVVADLTELPPDFWRR